MSLITDEYMQKMLKTTKPYTLVILHRTLRRSEPGANAIIWEHGRRNFELRRDGILSIVCPAAKDQSDVAGVCIFSTDLGKAKEIMDSDPAIKAGILVYDAHLIEGFPGDALP